MFYPEISRGGIQTEQQVVKVISDGTKCHDENYVGQSGGVQWDIILRAALRTALHSWHLQLMKRSCARHSVFQSSGETVFHSAVLDIELF